MSETHDHEQAIRDYYAHCDQVERAEAAELPPVPNIIAALDAGTATPELISEWVNHPYVGTTDIVRRSVAALLDAKAAEATQRALLAEQALANVEAERDREGAEHERTVDEFNGLADNMERLIAERDRLKAALEQAREWMRVASRTLRASGGRPSRDVALTTADQIDAALSGEGTKP